MMRLALDMAQVTRFALGVLVCTTSFAAGIYVGDSSNQDAAASAELVNLHQAEAAEHKVSDSYRRALVELLATQDRYDVLISNVERMTMRASRLYDDARQKDDEAFRLLRRAREHACQPSSLPAAGEVFFVPASKPEPDVGISLP